MDATIFKLEGSRSFRASWFSMDDYADKRSANVCGFSNKSSNVSVGDPMHGARNLGHLNSPGCSTRHGSSISIHNSGPRKIKYLKPPVRLKGTNSPAASSSRSLCSGTTMDLSYQESMKNLANNTECCAGQDKKEGGLKFNFEFPGRNKKIDFSQGIKSPLLHSSATNLTKTFNSSKASSASRYGKKISQNFESAIQDTINPPFRQTLVPRISIQIPKSIPQSAVVRPQRYTFPSCCSSDGHNKSAVQLRKKFHDGEGSSTGVSSLQGHKMPEDNLRRTNTQYNSRDVTVSGKNCLTVGGESSRMKSNEQEDEHFFQLPERSLFPSCPRTSLAISEVIQERSQLPFVSQNISFAGIPWSNSRSFRCRSVSHSEGSDDYLGLNMEGIAEVLHALEMIERGEELTYAQLMVLEANLLEGFSFHDQHRDMRMDIDNMTYEDLLALEEKMGSVSTAVPEDSLWKCLKKNTHKTMHVRGCSGRGSVDIKCSICQEEYVIGEEVGRLPCKHHYHVACIHQWLRLKNLCPICKSPPFLS